MDQVYVVRDASGEYVSGKYTTGERTPASDEAKEFETREEAQAVRARYGQGAIS